MRIAVVHYHLRPGGVTRVIEHAVSSLVRQGIHACVLTGEPPPPSSSLAPVSQVVEGLGYEDAPGGGKADNLPDRLEESAREALKSPPDLWHFHNHSLGKNCALTRAVGTLGRRGRRLLLQIHDFAEDGRPDLFRKMTDGLAGGKVGNLGTVLYPQAETIHYAVINSRDQSILSAIGFAGRRLHLLSDPIELKDAGEEKDTAAAAGGRFFLYPTRAIRRKNLGEFLLWAARGEPGDRFAVTLAPQTLHQRRRYERWAEFARELGLPVEFEVGKKRGSSFIGLLRSANAAVTTSITEGFGLAFLEPWLAGRPLAGRNLPEITEECVRAGVDLSGLYERLIVPGELVGRDDLRSRISSGFKNLRAAYGRGMSPEEAGRALAAASADGGVDFGRLDEELQEAVIREIRGDPVLAAAVRPGDLFPAPPSASVIRRNRTVVSRRFGLKPYGRKLSSIYRKLGEAPAGGKIEGIDIDLLLDQFLTPERFFLLKT